MRRWALHRRYTRWAATFTRCPVLAIDVRDYDLVADPSAIDHVAELVRGALEPAMPQTELFVGTEL